MAKKASQIENITKDPSGDGYIRIHADGKRSRLRKDYEKGGCYVDEEDGTVFRITGDRDDGKIAEIEDSDGRVIGEVSIDKENGKYIADHYGGSTTEINVNRTSEAGDLIIIGLVVGAVISILYLFTMKHAWLPLLILTAAVVGRMILNKKLKTGYFFFWSQPITIAAWTYLMRCFMLSGDDRSVSLSSQGGFVFGMLFLFFAILFSCGSYGEDGRDGDFIIDKIVSCVKIDHMGYSVFAIIVFLIGSLLGSTASTNDRDMVFSTCRFILLLLILAVIATPIWIIKRWKEKTGPRIIKIPAHVVQDGINDRYAREDRYYFYGWASKWGEKFVWGKLFAIWNAQGRPSERNIVTISGHYLVTVPSRFGQVGDRLTVVLSGGTKFSAIIANTRSGIRVDEYILDRWEKDVIRFQTKNTPIDLTGWQGKKVVKILNHGTCEDLK